MRSLFGGKKNKIKPLWERFADLGVSLVDQPDLSARICQQCYHTLGKVEQALATLKAWQSVHNREAPPAGENTEKRRREDSPSESPRPSKKSCSVASPQKTTEAATQTPFGSIATELLSDKAATTAKHIPFRSSTTEVFVQYASKRVRLPCHPDMAGIIEHLAKANWKTAAKQIVLHRALVEELKPGVLDIVEGECRVLCDQKQSFVLRQCSPNPLKTFSFTALDNDLRRLAPFISSIFSTITKHQSPHTACAAAAIALRGRESRLSAFSYYVNSVLQRGRASKTAFKRLSKLGITTSYTCAVQRQRQTLCEKTKSSEPGYIEIVI